MLVYFLGSSISKMVLLRLSLIDIIPIQIKNLPQIASKENKWQRIHTICSIEFYLLDFCNASNALYVVWNFKHINRVIKNAQKLILFLTSCPKSRDQYGLDFEWKNNKTYKLRNLFRGSKFIASWQITILSWTQNFNGHFC